MIWLLFGSAVLLILVLVTSIVTGYSSFYWPTVSGKVVFSLVQTRQNKHSSSKTRYYHPVVKYEYYVNGKRYSSSRLGNFLAFGDNRKFAEEIVSRFSAGSEIKVYYFPFCASWSILMPGMHQIIIHMILLFTGIILLLATIPVLFTDNPYGFIDRLFGIFT